jgi:hypothetical protein
MLLFVALAAEAQAETSGPGVELFDEALHIVRGELSDDLGDDDDLITVIVGSDLIVICDNDDLLAIVDRDDLLFVRSFDLLPLSDPSRELILVFNRNDLIAVTELSTARRARELMSELLFSVERRDLLEMSEHQDLLRPGAPHDLRSIITSLRDDEAR